MNFFKGGQVKAVGRVQKQFSIKLLERKTEFGFKA